MAAIASAGAFFPMVQLLGIASPAIVQSNAAVVLMLLAQSAEYVGPITAAGAIALLVLLLGAASSDVSPGNVPQER